MSTRPWAIASLFQFAAGAALALGVLGVVRSGGDRWMGVALIVLSAAFALRSDALRDEQRRRDNEQLAKQLDKLGRAEVSNPARPWWRRLFG